MIVPDKRAQHYNPLDPRHDASERSIPCRPLFMGGRQWYISTIIREFYEVMVGVHGYTANDWIKRILRAKALDCHIPMPEYSRLDVEPVFLQESDRDTFAQTENVEYEPINRRVYSNADLGFSNGPVGQTLSRVWRSILNHLA